MSDVDLFSAVLAIALSHGARKSAGLASRTLLDAPLREMSHVSEFLEWYEGNVRTGVLTVDHLNSAAELAKKTIEAGIEIVPIVSDRYPAYLRTIEDAPPAIYVRGNSALLAKPAGVSVVGTRKASPAGIKIADRIAFHFAERGWTIVSGLALGIDAAAHRGALRAKGDTIAVLAHGLQSASPKANSYLGDEILATGGAWISEHPLGVSARPEFFVLRNRIQIGLSAGSIIVEGEERSGTMTQAEFCLRNRRHLFAVLPENTESLKLVSKGPLILINKRGATPLRSRDDYDAAARAMEARRLTLATAQLSGAVTDLGERKPDL
ncbi:DNA-processing protein DprA [Paraburkholderia caribensis]|uniref:DNA-processing protein DprA n=1 Tax=Paraburkholderia caribensis TaxID=75105 RepID=UPI00286605F5|nr:DNA-processing protein DprA [Paraburkholderia caribensis]MDR6383988.1 DNA processing protein [Paraburkholderia caribensis]